MIIIKKPILNLPNSKIKLKMQNFIFTNDDDRTTHLFKYILNDNVKFKKVMKNDYLT